MRKQLANERARFAFKEVSGLKKNLKKEFSRYRSLVRSFPAMILTNGYGSAMAFLFSKQKTSSEGLLYIQLSKWLNERSLFKSHKEDLMEYITEQSQDVYRQLTSETLALLEWLKRFAEGMDR
ncbi:hypothetical protein GCM10011391_12560 [Pullulanibacillus camelliae]|uniref:CRISPR type III-B/RAMP module-associated protein Cmr5 n=1 Tax=Pullulanibacillus camelliae TaxID=1707096 RepID=A0A8J2YC19_9BACL|nr:type III-B CRISPR module-associated protein Cmr5 [Pullulanibacillus camelliae]GGE35332.1 hypothetical protein GCM10011391_12560 [Pullulanibacillus camelliae]